MNIPPPSEKQARFLWFSLTALAASVLAGLLCMLLWGAGVVIEKLTPVLLPLAVAGVGAYLLEPIVAYLVKRGLPRVRAIILVFMMVILFGLGLLATVVPRLVVESREFVRRAPEYSQNLNQRATNWMAQSTLVQKLVKQNSATGGTAIEAPALLSWLGKVFPAVREWFVAQAARLVSWVGLVLGLLLAPIYVFYFLLEREGIESWRDYLPIRRSKLKEEVVFVLSSINDSLIVFFRGQVLVSLCSGTLLTIAFMSMGLNYALFLGVLAGVLGIIPYLGAAISLIPALTLAAVQYQDWLHPLLVLASFGLVNLIESFVISPKIIGDRVGLHPLAIMVAMMVGTTLLGGLLGGLLAIPFTAALRTIMFRYIWRKMPEPVESNPKPNPEPAQAP